MMMWIEVIYVVAAFVVRNPDIVLGGRCRPFVHLKVFAQRVTRRIEPARYEGGRRRTLIARKALSTATSRKVDSDNLGF
jgi:hypothetical protein